MANSTQWLTKALINLISTELASEVQVSTTGTGLSLSMPVGNGNQTHITLDGLLVDATNGLEGHLHLDISNAQGLSMSPIDGFKLSLTGFDLQLQQAGLTTADIKAQLTIPYFSHADGTQEVIDVDLGVRHDGSLTLTLSPQQSNPDHTTPDGLLKLTYNIGKAVTIELDIDALEFDNPSPHVYELVMSGKLLITTEGLQWPSFEFKGLHIDNQAHVQLDGGWINLPASTALDFYGFNLSLQQLGFGSDTSGRWIGFNGDIQLVEGVPLGGSVRGLRLNLENGDLALASVAISFEIPDVLSFSGEIDHIAATDVNGLIASGIPASVANSMAKISPTIFPANIFMGYVDVTIIVADNLEVDAQFIVGNFGSTPVFFLVLDVELPVGIPIFLDVALYGMEGLFASNLRPDPTQSGESWWDWYKNAAPGSPGSAYSATDVMKWLPYPHPGAFALGAGVTIGTEADDGFTASAGITFILMLPGPVIMFVGKAKILSKRVSNAGDYDAGGSGVSFEAMATYDGSAGTFDLDIEAQYKIPVVLDIEASAVLHVAPPDWYFAMGLPPREKRVRASIFDLFEADAYFVVGDTGLLLGAYIGYNKGWNFGPLSVGLDAYIAMEGAIQWSPLVIAGGLELHGDAHLDAFGIGIGISVDALLEGKAPNPFWVHGEFDVELDLPWPLPDVGASINLTWGGDNDYRPSSPLPLSHVDATLIDHVGSSDHYTLLSHRLKWPAPDAALVYDSDINNPGLLVPTQTPMTYWASVWASQQFPQVNPLASLSPDQILAVLPDANVVLGSIPPYATVIPQDAHFTIDFAHPVNDQTGGGFTNGTSSPLTEQITVSVPNSVPPDTESHINLNPPSPQWIRIYDLHQVALYEYTNGQWQVVASQAQSQSPPLNPPPSLKGAWLATDPSNLNGKADNTRLKIIPQMAANSSSAIVPDGQRLYALKVVTSVTSQHTDGSNSQTDSPLIEFAYFQTASGPGVGIIDTNQPSPLPIPYPAVSAPYAQQGEQVPSGPVSSVFPLGGQLLDLHTYTQWSWPDDGDVASYYGYDLNVEFNEAYVYNLYTSSPDSGGTPITPHIAARFVSTGGQGASSALHMRCVDRNNQHVLLIPDAIHVPSIIQQSALESMQYNLPQPPAIMDTGRGIQLINSAILSDIHLLLQPQARVYEQQQLLGQLSQGNTPAIAAVTAAMASNLKVQEQATLQELAARGQIALTPAQLQDPSLISPSWSSVILKQAEEEAAAQSARAIWPRMLLPGTRYTLDVVAGPIGGYNPSDRESAGSAFIILAANSFQGADAITILTALEDFYTYEDALTSLQRVQFTTSSYATFTEHLANAVEQVRIANGTDPGKPGVAPLRFYPTASDMTSWLNDVTNGDGSSSPLALYQNSQNTYTQAQSQIASFVGGFNPLDDNLPPNLPPPPKQPPLGPQQLPPTPTPNWPFPGQAGLRVNRQITQQAWTDFSQNASLFFDKAIVALGRADLVSNQHVPAPPNTELSEFADSAGRIQALLLESPEPLPWRRIWQWLTLQGVDSSALPLNVLPLWSADGTRGLLIPLEQQSTAIAGNANQGEVMHTADETSSPLASEFDPEATIVRQGASGIVHLPPSHPISSGQYILTISFHGNIGAEVPCIITNGERESIEDVTFAPLALLPSIVFRPPPRPIP